MRLFPDKSLVSIPPTSTSRTPWLNPAPDQKRNKKNKKMGELCPPAALGRQHHPPLQLLPPQLLPPLCDPVDSRPPPQAYLQKTKPIPQSWIQSSLVISPDHMPQGSDFSSPPPLSASMSIDRQTKKHTEIHIPLAEYVALTSNRTSSKCSSLRPVTCPRLVPPD